MRSVVIRVDSSSRIGSGHLARCRTLGRELARRGTRVRFVCRAHATSLDGAVTADGFELLRLPPPLDEGRPQPDEDYAAALGVSELDDAAQTRAALGEEKPDWLLVDHYALGATWEQAMRGCASRLMVLDDLANREHDCDVLVDQNWFGPGTEDRYAGLVPPACRLLLGPRYALLQPEYAELRRIMPTRGTDVRRIAVYFGASDDTNQTLKVLEALSHPDFTAVSVDTVLGHNHPAPDDVIAAAERRGLTAIHRGLPTLAEVLMRAHLAIGAGGATTWERAALGLPSIVTVLARNQRELADALAADGTVRLVDAAASVAEWRSALGCALADRDWLQSAALRSAALTDGAGTARVVHVLSSPLRVRVRAATTRDEGLLLEWANDPDVRRRAFDERPIAPADHARWLAAKLADRGCLLLIGEDAAGLAVGQVRFDLEADRDEAVIDISVDPAFRGLGVGTRLLAAALGVWRERALSSRAVAEVRDGNMASAQLFARLGFVPTPRCRADAARFVYSR